MNKNEEKLKFVEASMLIEGMKLSDSNKKTLRDCLSGKVGFNAALQSVIAKYTH